MHSQRIFQNVQFQENNDFLTQLVNVTNMLVFVTGGIPEQQGPSHQVHKIIMTQNVLQVILISQYFLS